MPSKKKTENESILSRANAVTGISHRTLSGAMERLMDLVASYRVTVDQMGEMHASELRTLAKKLDKRDQDIADLDAALNQEILKCDSCDALADKAEALEDAVSEMVSARKVLEDAGVPTAPEWTMATMVAVALHAGGVIALTKALAEKRG